MRFSVQLPTDRVANGSPFIQASTLGEIGRAVERAGFDAGYVTDHPFPADSWLASGGHHALDPFVALAAIAASTERLRLHANLLVLPYRNPFLTAKALASLDAISSGRVIAGVGAGYLEGEARALGADFARRNEDSDDALRALKHAWSGESTTWRGRGYAASGNTMLPRPAQRPHPPLWVGGNSGRALRRAVEFGDGWSPFPVPAKFSARARTAAIENVGDLATRIARLRDLCAAAGRTEPLDVNFVPFGHGMNSRDPLDPPALLEQLAALAKVGVTWVSIGLRFETLGEYLEQVDHFGREVIRPSCSS